MLSKSLSSPVVVIVQRVLPHYRIPFFSALRERLLAEGVDMRLVYGQEQRGTVPRTVVITESWAVQIENRYWRAAGVDLVWQPCLPQVAGAALVIVEQANRLLLNYLLLLRRLFGKRFKLAFFGHGSNMQARNTVSLQERMKRRLVNSADWWFAYTDTSRSKVLAAGFPGERLTVVNNTHDTVTLGRAVESLGLQGRKAVRKQLGLGEGPVLLYCGGLTRGKRLDFLIDACAVLQQTMRGFTLLIIGDGPENRFVTEAAHRYQWIYLLGGRFGNDRAPYLMASDALVMPGAVGLVIIDSFAAHTPLFTTAAAGHGPEIAYLENGVNGVITDNSLHAYAQALEGYLASPEEQQRLQSGCCQSFQKYTLEAMVGNFTAGILSSLSSR